VGRNEARISAGIRFGSTYVPFDVNDATRTTSDKTITVLFADNTSILITIPTKKRTAN